MTAARSMLAHAYRALGCLKPAWAPVFAPNVDSEWLDAIALTSPNSGRLRLVLEAIARELGSEQRKIIAAAFALRFGAVSSAALGPFLISHCVPDVRLSNIAVKFSACSLVERVALRKRCCSAETPRPVDAAATLRAALCDQAEPVVRALSSWSKLKQSVLWGLVVSAWGDQLLEMGRALSCSERALQIIEALISASHPAFQLPPRYYVAAEGGETTICQIRGSCCLNYRIPGNDYCASCPLRQRGLQRTKLEYAPSSLSAR